MKISNKDWIKRTVVFLKSVGELKLRGRREDAQEVPENRESMLAKRPSPERGLVR